MRRATRPGTARRRRPPGPGRDALEEVARGVEKSVTFRRQATCATCDGSGSQSGHRPETCATCGGQGRVRVQQGFLPMVAACPRCRGEGRIVTHPCTTCRGGARCKKEVTLKVPVPAGIGGGIRCGWTGRGPGRARGQPGDLYTVIREAEHPFFERDGDHLVCEVPITFPQAALPGPDLGADAGGPGPRQGTRRDAVGAHPAPARQGAAQRRGPRPRQLVRLQIETPESLTPRQRSWSSTPCRASTPATAAGRASWTSSRSFSSSFGPLRRDRDLLHQALDEALGVLVGAQQPSVAPATWTRWARTRRPGP
ncbi:MAG: DnaJ C-terminal domain-containing protein [bacterium]